MSKQYDGLYVYKISLNRADIVAESCLYSALLQDTDLDGTCDQCGEIQALEEGYLHEV